LFFQNKVKNLFVALHFLVLVNLMQKYEKRLSNC
jgi:hypothetical protein